MKCEECRLHFGITFPYNSDDRFRVRQKQLCLSCFNRALRGEILLEVHAK